MRNVAPPPPPTILTPMPILSTSWARWSIWNNSKLHYISCWSKLNNWVALLTSSVASFFSYTEDLMQYNLILLAVIHRAQHLVCSRNGCVIIKPYNPFPAYGDIHHTVFLLLPIYADIQVRSCDLITICACNDAQKWKAIADGKQSKTQLHIWENPKWVPWGAHTFELLD